MRTTASGYQEMPHTADIALLVWADSIPELFRQAGKGMRDILKAQVNHEEPVLQKSLALEEMDLESLLVAFMSELLFYYEQDGVLFEPVELRLENHRLVANLAGYRVSTSGREIKAVTYSNLTIAHINGGYETTLVFDI